VSVQVRFLHPHDKLFNIRGGRSIMKKHFTIIFLFWAFIGCLPKVSIEASPVLFFGEDLNLSYHHLHVSEFTNAVSVQKDFLRHLDGVRVEDFEDFEPGGAGLSIDFGAAGTATLTGGYVAGAWNSHAITNGRFSTSTTGDKFLEVRTSDASQGGAGSFSLAFAQAQSAFGFFATDFENSRTTVTLETASGGVTTVVIPATVPSPSGSVLFFGIIDPDSPFVRVTFDGVNFSRDWFGFDDFTIAIKDQVISTSPEPGTLLLISAGLFGLLFYRRAS
jgi:hypothetical protein